MTFRYSPRSRRPNLAGWALANGKSFDFVGVVDSGADHSIFPFSAAFALGIDPMAGDPQVCRGASGQSVVYLLPLTLAFAFGSFAAQVGFMETAPETVLLGQTGLFDFARITMDRRAGIFTIEPYGDQD
jgi:hypothetical protein